MGVEGTVNRVPAALAPVYGSRTPVGFAVYVRLRPSRMRMGETSGGMEHRGHGMASPMLTSASLRPRASG